MPMFFRSVLNKLFSKLIFLFFVANPEYSHARMKTYSLKDVLFQYSAPSSTIFQQVKNSQEFGNFLLPRVFKVGTNGLCEIPPLETCFSVSLVQFFLIFFLNKNFTTWSSTQHKTGVSGRRQ